LAETVSGHERLPTPARHQGRWHPPTRRLGRTTHPSRQFCKPSTATPLPAWMSARIAPRTPMGAWSCCHPAAETADLPIFREQNYHALSRQDAAWRADLAG